MTQQQIQEAERSITLLKQCREHLDNAMYRMGDISIADPQYHKCRKAYDFICKALDQF